MKDEAEVIDVEAEEKPSTLPVPKDSIVMDAMDLRKAVEFESERIELMQKFVASKMKKGTHFGTIPGTSKPTLFKSGAEVMCGIYKYGGRYEIKVTDDPVAVHKLGSTGYYEAQVRCTLFHIGSQQLVGEGVGSCNSWEKKYLRKDVYDLKNTILKMAKKRAYVDATLSACRLSDFFTQDMEDVSPAGDTPTPTKPAYSEERAERASQEASDEPSAAMREDMRGHCGGDFAKATRLMQLMAQWKPDCDLPKGWGAMDRANKNGKYAWLAATEGRYKKHKNVCNGTDCPELIEAIHKEQGFVKVD